MDNNTVQWLLLSYGIFDESIKPRLDSDCLLHSALVGQEKHLLDLVDVNLPLVAVVPAFGKHLQYKVNFKEMLLLLSQALMRDFRFASWTSYRKE